MPIASPFAASFVFANTTSSDVVLDLCRLLPTSYAVEVRPVVRIEGYDDTRVWE